MDALLERVGHQAINLALRSGIALTSGFAVQQCNRLLKTVDDKKVQTELAALQKLLNNRIKILSPVIDLIEFKSGRGNVFLEGAVPLVKSLNRDIVELGKRLENAATTEENSRRAGAKGPTAAARVGLTLIITDIKNLLDRIDQDIPLIQLAITASGESLSTALPPGVSPSRLMQASTFLSFGDIQFASDPTRLVQVGPSFALSMYLLFVAHGAKEASRGRPSTPKNSPSAAPQPPYGIGEGDRKPIWQEVIHKARVRLCRTPLHWEFNCEQGYRPKAGVVHIPDRAPANEDRFGEFTRPDQYSYHLEIVENLEDGRVHDEEGAAYSAFDDIPRAGIRESIPIHQISKIFYTDTGRILNIGDADDGDNNPVLLLKRDTSAPTPSRLREEWAQDHGSPLSNHDNENRREQHDVDRQLREESEGHMDLEELRHPKPSWQLPQHLDDEWIAFEVHIEDNDGGSENDDCTEDEKEDGQEQSQITLVKRRAPRSRSSVDSRLLAQIRNISLRSPPDGGHESGAALQNLEKTELENSESFVARSPFGAVASSLSLLEMLIRLTSLQEFQQVSHLAIPDHITTFFLEETSTTGLRGEDRWKERREAKRKVGFDPYTDTPTR
ncbi:Ran-binding-domain-containing protein [Thozetella sp. PMI_491]|nr:Ran-binding-domain-containing protein [Thozetella sp. PMI_491]